MSADKILSEAAKTFEERGKIYGNNYLNAGAALAALLPNGLNLKTADDHVRYHIFTWIVGKLSRYAINFEKGGHQDSIHDTVVYAAILEDIDAEINARSQK